MEPISAFFKAPLLVLDFQSLYPSVMVAYNYCYSTCLGRIDTFKGKNKLGVLDHLDVPVGLMEKLSPHFNGKFSNIHSIIQKLKSLFSGAKRYGICKTNR